ncbi:MAG UNVERIFIED_CONTAM: hypothetical protein LVR18_46410 [Planctomycetaceae bacterium]|jgi:UDP-N-acetylmuramoylalanine-D-glutamate ligase
MNSRSIVLSVAADFRNAFELAVAMRGSGDIVLLSPGCPVTAGSAIS